MFRRLGRKAQTTAEYAILIALVVGAIVAMQVYVRRGIQGRIKNAMDHTGVSGNVSTAFNFTNEQYEPYYLASDTATSSARTQQEVLGTGGMVSRVSAEQTIQARQQKMAWTVTDTAANQTVDDAVAPTSPALTVIDIEDRERTDAEEE